MPIGVNASARPRSGDDRGAGTGTGPVRPPTWAVLAGMVAAALILGIALVGTHRWRPEAPAGGFEVAYGIRSTGINRLLVDADGLSYADMATDPSLARPQQFGSASEAAYRAQRPLFGWAAWALSFGQPHYVRWALLVLEIASAGLMAGALQHVVGPRALWVFALPPTWAIVGHLLPELAGLGLVVLGVTWWREERWWQGVAAFTLAGLCRETYLIVPVVLGAWSVLSGMQPRCAARLLVPGGIWLGWMAVVVARVGALPASRDGRARLAPPFTGITTSHWGLTGWLVAVAAVVFPAVAFARRRTIWSTVAVAYLLLGTVMGPAVWLYWVNFGRPLLPALVFAGISLLPGLNVDASAGRPQPWRSAAAHVRVRANALALRRAARCDQAFKGRRPGPIISR